MKYFLSFILLFILSSCGDHSGNAIPFSSNIITSDSFSRNVGLLEVGSLTDAGLGGFPMKFNRSGLGRLKSENGELKVVTLDPVDADSNLIINVGTQNVCVQAKIIIQPTAAGAGTANLMARMQDDGGSGSNFIGFASDPSGNNYYIAKIINTNGSVLGVSAQIPLNGDIMKLCVSGSSISAYVNGSLLLSATETTLNSSTYNTIAISITDESAITIDDLIVSRP